MFSASTYFIVVLVSLVGRRVDARHLKGAPTRTDTIVLDANAGPLFTQMTGVTVLDTGLTITAAVCDITDAVSKLVSRCKALYYLAIPPAFCIIC